MTGHSEVTKTLITVTRLSSKKEKYSWNVNFDPENQHALMWAKVFVIFSPGEEEEEEEDGDGKIFILPVEEDKRLLQ